MHFVDSTLHALRQLPYFKKVPDTRLQAFSTELLLVSRQVRRVHFNVPTTKDVLRLGCSLRDRTGYLFDGFSLHGQYRQPSYILADTIHRLRKVLMYFNAYGYSNLPIYHNR